MRRWAGAAAALLLLATLRSAQGLGAARLEEAGSITDAHGTLLEHDASTADVVPLQDGEAGAAAADQAAVQQGPQDDSVRCRLSGICEGQHVACADKGTDAAVAAGKGEDVSDLLACLTSDADRASAVLDAARHAWDGYRRAEGPWECAWGEDELRPLSCSGMHWLNLSLTMVDSLDTLYLLGMTREFEEAAEWLADRLDVGAPSAVNLFETTIRILGGLLSAHALSAPTHPALSHRLAEKAVELGARLMPAFGSPSGVPFSDVNLRTGETSMPAWGHISSLSEISSVSLEFTYLARITGHSAFERVPLAVHEQLEQHAAADGGLLGQYFNPLTGKASGKHGATITLGARSDSYYEYLLKQWLLTGKSEGWLRERYVQAMRSVRSRLLKRTMAVGRPGLWYVAEQVKGGGLSGKMDHLVCFLPGLLALGDYHELSTQATASAAGEVQKQADDGTSDQQQGQQHEWQGVNSTDMPDLQLAAELALSCYELYRRTPVGLAPEIAHFANNSELQDFPNRHVHDVGHGDFSIKPKDAHNLLRPEAVESFYLLWKVTGDPQYQQWAWQVFRALEKWARVRPEGRHWQCATCKAQATHLAVQAAEAAAAAAASGEAGRASEQEQEQGGQQLEQQQQQEQGSQQPQQQQPPAPPLDVQGDGSFTACTTCSRAGGYSSLESVLSVPPQRRDKMESFFLAETLKYLYLIFAEPPDRCLHPTCQAGAATDLQQQQQQGVQQEEQQQQEQKRRLLPLDHFVFTTEAHPLPMVGTVGASLVTQSWQPGRHLLHPFGEPSIDTAQEGDQETEGGSSGGNGLASSSSTGGGNQSSNDSAGSSGAVIELREAEGVLQAAAQAMQDGSPQEQELEVALGHVLEQQPATRSSGGPEAAEAAAALAAEEAEAVVALPAGEVEAGAAAAKDAAEL